MKAIRVEKFARDGGGINKYIRASKHTMSLKQKNSSRKYLRMAAWGAAGSWAAPHGKGAQRCPPHMGELRWAQGGAVSIQNLVVCEWISHPE